ncbi:MAG TPA: hypothetical protein DD426_03105 [Clostridiaceae bacterium]|nr:hypothetical protein [Clostridiaceae bacterium]
MRKQFGEEYLFDLWIYNLKDDEASKILSDYRNLVIPAVSDKVLLLIAAKEKGDDVSFMEYGP